MTILGETGVSRAGLLRSAHQEWLRHGFCEAGINHDLGTAIDATDYYINTVHSTKYIRDKWDPFFEIIDIKEGYINNHHDLVIMRKR